MAFSSFDELAAGIGSGMPKPCPLEDVLTEAEIQALLGMLDTPAPTRTVNTPTESVSDTQNEYVAEDSSGADVENGIGGMGNWQELNQKVDKLAETLSGEISQIKDDISQVKSGVRQILQRQATKEYIEEKMANLAATLRKETDEKIQRCQAQWREPQQQAPPQ